MDNYVFIVRDMSELVEAVNEKMGDGYEPLGGPVVFPYTTKLGQAMIKRTRAVVDPLLAWKFMGEDEQGRRRYCLVSKSGIITDGHSIYADLTPGEKWNDE